MKMTFVAATVLSVVVAGSTARAGTVTTTADSGPGSLRQVIADAVAGETIDFQLAGSPPYVIILTTFLSIDKDLTIVGPGASELEISGNDLTQIFAVLPPAGDATLSGMTVRNGHCAMCAGCIGVGFADPNGPGARIELDRVVVRDCHSDTVGGGLGLGFNGSGSIRNSQFIDNDATVGGGGVVSGSPLSVSNTQFIGNTTPGEGGGLASVSSIVVVESRFIDNSAGTNGGGFLNSGGTALIANSHLEGNSADSFGGGIASQSNLCDLTMLVEVTGSRITNNDGGDGAGGVFGNEDCPLMVRDSTIDHNDALTGDGGGIYAGAGSTLTVSGTTIAQNSAQNTGGGVFVGSAASSAFANTTISGNTSGTLGGTGVHYDDGSTNHLSNATIAGNVAGGGAGGILADTGATVAFRNTIIAGNSSPLPASHDCSGAGITTLGYNLTGQGTGCPSAGTGDQTVDPDLLVTTVLAPLAPNGGIGATHALLVGSPAIDSGDPAGCKDHDLNPITSDQRRVPRPLDGNADGMSLCDIGGYEAAAPSQSLADVDGNGQVQALTDGLLTLRYAFGLRDAALVGGAVAANCVRCTADAIEAFLSLMF